VDAYRLAQKNDISEMLKFFIEEKPDFTWAIQMLHEQDPDLLKDLEEQTKQTIENQLKEDEEIFLFASKPFETFESEEDKQIFKHLKSAVKNREYRTITFVNPNGKEYIFEDAKCLKIVYITGKWYIALETKEQDFKLRRLKRIKKIGYGKIQTYRKNILDKYRNFFLKLEDAHMKPSDKIKTARLRVTGRERYRFTTGNTKFFKSQKHIETNEEEMYVVFTVEYGDEMEILPFIKHWLPNIIIEKPTSLNKRLRSDIKKTIDFYGWKNMTKPVI
jgi:predicted DNA-binding transcriptional regulator YafY